MTIFEDSDRSLTAVVRTFARLGWPLIPLNGDRRPDAAKAPALRAWRAYHYRRPHADDLREWFDEQGHTAAGVVLGKISGLLVLDIDTPQRAEAFVRQCPDLLQTFTVRSGLRGLPHYYFRAPAGLTVPGRNGEGVELRSSGQYVVAPGSRIGGAEWRVIDDREPRTLTPADLRRLLDFIGCEPPAQPVTAVNAPSAAIPAPSDFVSQTNALSAATLLRQYARLAPRLGRNNALFVVGCRARDHGWDRQDLIMTLAPAHIHMAATGDHPAQTPAARHAEARATLTSVYSRPPRPTEARAPRAAPGLPNAIREKLLQLGLERVARVLDGLLLAGFQAGQAFTVAQAQLALSALGIGRNIVRAALNAVIEVGQKCRNALSPASPLDPPSPPANAAKRYAEKTKQCLFGRVTNPVKTPGRPAAVYTLPPIDDLCDLLDVPAPARHLGDPLCPQDVASPAAYRTALHTALIRRAPGRYPRRWQAQRLGVSAVSCRRYERRAGVQVTASYESALLGWHNIDRLLTAEPPPGRFIEDERGRRYPALPGLARRLLAQGKRLIFKRQDANHYRLASEECCGPQHSEKTPLFEKSGQKLSLLRRVAPQSEALAAPVQIDVAAVNCSGPEQSGGLANCCGPQQLPLPGTRSVAGEGVKGSPTPCGGVGVEPPRKTTKTRTKQNPDPDSAIEAGDRLYATLRRLDPDHALTRRRARQVVQAYGPALVRRGLDVIASRKQVRRPAGFLLTWLRSEQPSVTPPVQRRRAANDPARDAAAWIERLSQSPDLDYIANADDFRGVDDKLISE